MNEDDPLRGTLAALTTQIQHEVARRVESFSAEIAAAERRGMDAGREQAQAAASRSARESTRHLLDAVATLDDAARSGRLANVLDRLASVSAHDGIHSILFTRRDNTLHVWNPARSSSDSNNVTDSLTLDADSPLAAFADAGDVAPVPSEGRSSSFVALAGTRPGIAIPLAIGGEVVAVLYADRDGHAPVSNLAGDADWHLALQVLVRHAARCLEAMTALRAARLVASQTAWLQTSADDSAPAARPEQDGEVAHQAAHRYARLLISEIKLYHEDAITAGRRERDLLSRLGGEIARAQALYDERVPEPIRRSTDFFRAEVVKTLAGGDEGLLEHRN